MSNWYQPAHINERTRPAITVLATLSSRTRITSTHQVHMPHLFVYASGHLLRTHLPHVGIDRGILSTTAPIPTSSHVGRAPDQGAPSVEDIEFEFHDVNAPGAEGIVVPIAVRGEGVRDEETTRISTVTSSVVMQPLTSVRVTV